MNLNRSRQMSRIRGVDTSPEKLLRSALWQRGLRFRKNFKLSVARPDLVFLSRKIAVFIDGCFWHGCPDHYVRPRSRGEFWAAKLTENVLRDRRQTLQLEEAGWAVIRVWEHEIFSDLQGVVVYIESALSSTETSKRPQWRVAKVSQLPIGGDMEQRDLVDLRDDSLLQSVCGKRSTKKW